MRYRVQFRYREDTGEVEVFRVETVNADARARGHNAEHDRVTREVAGLLENDAVIEEIQDTTRAVGHAARHARRYQIQEGEQQQQPPETHGA